MLFLFIDVNKMYVSLLNCKVMAHFFSQTLIVISSKVLINFAL